ncbi:MAG: hypothetical protein COA73_08600 [Candidatus Hydrogenedentota bacterium]|nr:MAG: hypothetical protein COA73_08600 [Candidatus Hydrogenedentota bacterium]
MYQTDPSHFKSSKLLNSYVVIVAIGALFTLNGCSGGGSSTTAPEGIAGSWSGFAFSSSAGEGILTLDIIEFNTRDTFDQIALSNGMYSSSISGTWIADFDGDFSDQGGTFFGSNSDGTYSGVLNPITGFGCPTDFSWMIIDGNLSGDFTSFDCSVEQEGDFFLANIPETQIRDIGGVYSGTIITSFGGQGTVTLDITQTGLNFSAGMTANFLDSEFDLSGTFVGTIDGDTLQMKFFSNVLTDCPYSVTGTVSGGTSESITGSFFAFACSENIFGEFNISR